MYGTLFIVLTVSATIWAYENICGTGPSRCDPNVVIRKYDGSCNNLRHPKWGSVRYLYQRLLPAVYDDGISSYRRAKSGNPLPNSRYISSQLYIDKEVLHPNLTLNIVSFGSMFTHDQGSRLLNFQRPTNCCTEYFRFAPFYDPERCTDIRVPPSDPFYAEFGVECIRFIRTENNLNNFCSTSYKSAQQLNQYTAHLDLHPLYGISVEQNRQLRTLHGGLLRVERKNDQDFFQTSHNPAKECAGLTDLVGETGKCFKAGDTRNSLTLHISLMNVIMLREHNRIARALSQLNPHWDDERIFQTARTIHIGVFQHICLAELVSAMLGEDILHRHGLLHRTDDFVDEYDVDSDPGPLQEFTHASFRQPHSMVNGPIMLANEKRECTGIVNFDDNFNDVTLLEKKENFDSFTRGLSTQLSWEADRYHGNATIHRVFKNLFRIGLDTKAYDIERGRDHGLRPYNDYRELCGLRRAHKFSDFCDVMDEESALLLEEIYEHPDDVDFVVGGSLERNIPNAVSGPTFSCIFIKQIRQIRKSDRFFYDHRNGPFNLEQLGEIRKGSLSRWLCDNSHNVKSMQPNAFFKVSPNNQLVPCDSLPSVDLTKWKDPFIGPIKKQVLTNYGK